MNQIINNCYAHTRFQKYDDTQWQILAHQLIKKFGAAVQEEEFDYQCVPENWYKIVEDFRRELFQRRLNLL